MVGMWKNVVVCSLFRQFVNENESEKINRDENFASKPTDPFPSLLAFLFFEIIFEIRRSSLCWWGGVGTKKKMIIANLNPLPCFLTVNQFQTIPIIPPSIYHTIHTLLLNHEGPRKSDNERYSRGDDAGSDSFCVSRARAFLTGTRDSRRVPHPPSYQ